MPLPVVPKRSGVHRIAGIALFRALLSKCRLQPEASDTLQNVVRNRFRSNRELQSPRLLGIAFRAGYEALSILNSAAAGDVTGLIRVQSLLAQVPDRLKRAPRRILSVPARTKPAPKTDQLASPPANDQHSIHQEINEIEQLAETPRPTSTSATDDTMPEMDKMEGPMRHEPRRVVLHRPYPQVSGIRRIPIWTRAHGVVPFLRITKPQPIVLSAAIATRIERKHRWVQTRAAIDGTMIPVAWTEDEWDQILAREFPTDGDVVKEVRRGGAWTAELRSCVDELNNKLYDDHRASLKLSKKMAEIVEEERGLAAQERNRRRYERRQRRRIEEEEGNIDAVE